MRGFLCLLPLAAATPALADPGPRLYERALMAEADRRCGLFTPDVRSALTVARLQARSAVVRARGDAAAVERRARRRATGLSCASPDVRLAAARVREGHAGWARLSRMNFPGGASAWRADRTRSEDPRWRVVQAAPGAQLGLASGVVSPELAFYVVARFPKAATPALARLTVGRQTFLAASREAAPATLAVAGKGRAWAFRFPAAASQALASASVRDTAQLSFVAAGTGGARSAPVEIGDYAAAAAFVGGL